MMDQAGKNIRKLRAQNPCNIPYKTPAYWGQLHKALNDPESLDALGKEAVD